MITEQFLNMCCMCAITDRKDLQGDLLTSINNILIQYEKNFINDLPLDLKGKFELTKILVKLKTQGKTKNSIIDDIISSGKFKEYESFIKLISEQEITDEHFNDYKTHIYLKRKFSLITKEFTKLSEFVEDFETNAFDNIGTAIEQYEDLISELYIDIAEEKRKDNVIKISSLDFMDDNFENVLDQIESSNSGINTVPSGYTELDRYLKGGYQPTRLYIFGGSSGDGKSTFLNNSVVNAVEKDVKDHNGLTNLYLYVTLENLLDESLMRTYACWKDINPDKIVESMKVNRIKERDNIRNFIKDKCKHNNSNIIMKYFSPNSLTVFGLSTWVQSIKEKYMGKGKIRALYVDYLDLLNSGKQYDIYRIELGQITVLLKALAVIENIPIITVTQLNREGYNKEVFSLTTMSESIKKVEHADVVCILHNQDESDPVGDYYKLDVYIGKNRCGPKNKKVTLLSKFSNFIIKDSCKGAGLTFDQGVKRSSVTYTEDFDGMNGFI